MTIFREHPGQLALAPGAQPFFRLELRHSEQMAEHLEPVAFRQLDQFGNSLGDEGHGLVRAALLTPLIGGRCPNLARSCALPAAPSLAQNNLHPIAYNIHQK